jgi:hypothetical protein
MRACEGWIDWYGGASGAWVFASMLAVVWQGWELGSEVIVREDEMGAWEFEFEFNSRQADHMPHKHNTQD